MIDVITYDLSTPLQSYGGVRIRETILAVQTVEDWSNCRSPSRAARRLRQGHMQRMVIRQDPACYEIKGEIYIHPLLNARLKAELSRRHDEMFEKAMRGGLSL